MAWWKKKKKWNLLVLRHRIVYISMDVACSSWKWMSTFIACATFSQCSSIVTWEAREKFQIRETLTRPFHSIQLNQHHCSRIIYINSNNILVSLSSAQYWNIPLLEYFVQTQNDCVAYTDGGRIRNKRLMRVQHEYPVKMRYVVRLPHSMCSHIEYIFIYVNKSNVVAVAQVI